MQVTIEFYGIPRERAGVATTTVAAESLGEVLAELADRFPAFARDCLVCEDEGKPALRLDPLFVASVGGERFITDPATPLSANETLLILSADAGG